MKFKFSFKWLESSDLAIDLGTTNTLIYTKEKGIILDEDSIVAINKKTGNLISAGSEVKEMIGRTPENILISRPLEDGVIADFKVVEEMLRHFISKIERKKLFLRPRVIVAVPSGITPVEKRAVKNSILEAGAREIFLISEPIAGALGMDIDVKDACGNMIVDIGGGTTEIAVLALSGIVNKVSIKIAGNELDEAIQTYLYDRYDLSIGKVTAENIKKDIGTAHPSVNDKEMEIMGRDMAEGMPRKITVNSSEIRESIREPLGLIRNALKKCLSETPPELSSDIVKNGISLTGGGALLPGIDRMIQESTDLKVEIAQDPLRCVVKGAGKVLENLEENKKLLMNHDK